jgi:hypothetical protein
MMFKVRLSETGKTCNSSLYRVPELQCNSRAITKKKNPKEIYEVGLGGMYVYQEKVVKKDLQHQSSLQRPRHRQGRGRRRWQ